MNGVACPVGMMWRQSNGFQGIMPVSMMRSLVVADGRGDALLEFMSHVKADWDAYGKNNPPSSRLGS